MKSMNRDNLPNIREFLSAKSKYDQLNEDYQNKLQNPLF